MLTSRGALAEARPSPAQTFLLLADDEERPLAAKPSVPRTALLAVAAFALMSGAPLYWASSAESSSGGFAAFGPKDPFSGDNDDAVTDCPGDDPDGTTAPGMTTSTDGKQGGTSTAGTSAPGVTTAPGATSTGGDQTTGQRDTTLGHDTSTAAGQHTTTNGNGTNTTAGETNETGAVQETETGICPPEAPQPPVTPPPPGPQQQVTPPPPAPGAAPPPAPVVVQGVQVRQPSARLRAPAGCPPQRFFARVTGRGIARVVFTVDGKRLRTLRRPDRAGVWKVRIDTRRYSTGKHRIVARVTFATASGAATRQANGRTSKTMSITFTKCARKAAAPKFTG